MYSLNRVTLIGRLTRDPEFRTTPDGTHVVHMGLATSMRWTNQAGALQEKTEFHNLVAWRGLADICNQYLKKGALVYFEGKLQTRSWDDASGVKKYRTEIVVENMIMLDRKSGVEREDSKPYPSQTQTSEPVIEETVVQLEQGPKEIAPEEIPF